EYAQGAARHRVFGRGHAIVLGRERETDVARRRRAVAAVEREHRDRQRRAREQRVDLVAPERTDHEVSAGRGGLVVGGIDTTGGVVEDDFRTLAIFRVV